LDWCAYAVIVWRSTPGHFVFSIAEATADVTLGSDPACTVTPTVCRAVQIIDNLELGGAQRLLATMAGQYPSDPGLSVLSLNGGRAPFRSILEAAGAQVATLGGLKLWHPLSIPRLAGTLRKRREPVVHIHLTYATILGTMAARLAGKSVVVSLHNAQTVAGASLRARVLRGLETFCLRHLTDRVIFVGANVERANRARIGRTPGVVVPNVIPLPPPLDPEDRVAIRQGLGAGPQDLVVIATGRLSAQKDPLLLVRAFAAARAKVGNLVLWVVGDGPLRSEVEALAGQLLPPGDPAAAPIRFLGPRDDVHRLLPAADIYALSSQWEGLPVALLEAMAAGRGIVCTRVGDIPDLLPEEAALMVQPGDEEGFASALVRMVEDQPLREARSARALDVARPYCDVAGWRQTLEGIYAELP
jgi:glycosyltransferase involved in cell wall biosynthesis